MENQQRNDLIISGMGSSAGGIFNIVAINGHGKINGDIDCIDFEVNGICSIEGNVKTELCTIDGKGKINGNVDANNIYLNGSTKIIGDVKVKDMKFNGISNIEGSVNAENIENNGVTAITGNCDAEVFKSKGAFNISGLLNAEKIDIMTYAASTVKEIGGENIMIRIGSYIKIKKFFKTIIPTIVTLGVTTDLIEGDDIYLEYTKAKIVRGKNIVLGKGCEIGYVEYTDHYEQSDKSKVQESKKVD